MVRGMGTLLRYLLSGFAGAFMAMFAEPFFSALLFGLGIDTSHWAGPVMIFISELAQMEWFRLLGAGVIGSATGAWLHWLATKWDRRKQPIKLSQTGRNDVEVDRIQQATRPLPPDIKAYLMGGSIFESTEFPGGATGLTINLKVWNIGSPTLIIKWELYIIPRGHTPEKAQYTEMPDVLRLNGAINSAVVKGADSIAKKLENTELEKNPVGGTLLFYSRLPKNAVIDKHTRLELVIHDLNGGEHKFEQLIGEWLSA